MHLVGDVLKLSVLDDGLLKLSNLLRHRSWVLNQENLYKRLQICER